MTNKKPTAIDLFAGAGGFSLAAKQAGFDVCAAVEIDSDACVTYAHNLIKTSSRTKLYQNDILTELTPEGFRDELSLKKGELDLLMGGPPCQGFSTHRINSAGVNDPRNKLLLRYFEFVQELRPKVFLVENVTGMLWKRHEQYLESFKSLAKESDYELLGPVVLNACDYGVPQNRKRVFILGIDKKVKDVNITWPPKPTHGPGLKSKWVSASTVFEKPPTKKLAELTKEIGKDIVGSLEFGMDVSKNDPCNVHMTHTQGIIDVFESTKINGSRTDSNRELPCHGNGYAGHKDVYGRIKLAQPTNTITTGCYNPSKGRFVHPWLHHGITIRHCARLQTFPDKFIFKGSLTNQSKQVGNAVPVKLGKLLIKEIKKSLLG